MERDDGQIIIEGDILIREPAEGETATGVFNDIVLDIEKFKWPSGNLIYDFGVPIGKEKKVCSSIPEGDVLRACVYDAMEIWTASAPVSFTPRKPGDKHFVKIIKANGCYANVGKRTDLPENKDNDVTWQTIALADWATVGNAMHEIGHALGIFHTHSRKDRNEYVKVPKNADKNYGIPGAGKNVLGYDYQSIMHYEMKAVGGQSVGQRNYLSHGDISAAIILYGKKTQVLPLLTAVPGVGRTVDVIGQAVNNQVIKTTKTERDSRSEPVGVPVSDGSWAALCSGISSIADPHGSPELFALMDTVTVGRMVDGKWMEFAKLPKAATGNLFPVGFDDSEPVVFGHYALGEVVKIRPGNNHDTINYGSPSQLPLNKPLNGSPITIVTALTQSNANSKIASNYHVFGINTNAEGESEVIHLCTSASGAWESLGTVPEHIGGGAIYGGLFASTTSCTNGRVDIFAFGANDHIIRLTYSEYNPGHLEWQDCGELRSDISGKWLAVVPVVGVGYDLFAANRHGEIQCFMYDLETRKLNTFDSGGTLKPVIKARYFEILLETTQNAIFCSCSFF